MKGFWLPFWGGYVVGVVVSVVFTCWWHACSVSEW